MRFLWGVARAGETARERARVGRETEARNAGSTRGGRHAQSRRALTMAARMRFRAVLRVFFYAVNECALRLVAGLPPRLAVWLARLRVLTVW
jgi:hypothetical protein